MVPCLVAQRSSGTLVLAHRQPLLDQWAAQLPMSLGIGDKAVAVASESPTDG